VTRVVAVVPAHDEESRVAATVAALRSISAISEIVVVDDGSSDGTARRARDAGARVLRLARNRGKAAAVAAGIRATDAQVVLLCDADLGASAAELAALLEPVLSGGADMAVAAPPATNGPSGFGLVERFARWGIERSAGRRTDRPLSGQRALRRDVLQGVRLARGFGVEVGLTIDVVRAGGRVVEIPCHITHARTGRTPAGFAHRARQGVAVARALARRGASR
jgi:glycosyltransferase involved in cell wall biosynthesis